MIIWVKKEAVSSDCDQRAAVKEVIEKEGGVPVIFIRLVETGDSFTINPEDIISIEIDGSLIAKFGQFEYKPKKKVIRKITEGRVVQIFVGDKCVRQQFVSDDIDSYYTSEQGKEMEDPDNILYHHSNMEQP